MKAILLAGGEGTRLKAVTGDLPKPMVPLLGRPLMEHILRLLKKHGFTQVCAALKYRPDDIRSVFGDGSDLGLSLEYRLETEDLGTAGAVKNCADFIGDEDVLVISGDAACDLDLKELFDRHRERGAIATLALHRDSAPLRYGLTVTDASGAIRAFVEKPRWGQVISDLVNTGIYVLSPRALQQIPTGKAFDFGHDLFPQLVKQKELVLGVPLKGYWCDVGTPLSYYQCCVDALEGRLQLEPGDAFQSKPPEQETETEPEGFLLELPCRDRAALMGQLSQWMLEMDADYSDGICLHKPNFELQIAPLDTRSALRIAVNAEDSEFARRLAFSAKELAEALEK